MKILYLILLVIIFILGFYSSIVFSLFYKENAQIPYISTIEKISPYDHIKNNQIQLYKDKIVIKVDNPTLTSYADTNSMDPLLDDSANGLEIIPKNEDDVHIGDIVAYESTLVDGLIVHRVISVNNDEKGLYYTLKGDNSSSPDPEKVRFAQIKYLLIGIIY